jgi:hypothetical protein
MAELHLEALNKNANNQSTKKKTKKNWKIEIENPSF